ncbi:MAG: DUF4344 domain-containing metallopeptidase [Xanthobacteraceae bacterium]|nr:DUF4344 domain-containing metallopeptidase [Xanthobacteraceae bacterium]
MGNRIWHRGRQRDGIASVRSVAALAIALLGCWIPAQDAVAARLKTKPNQIRIQYVPPTDPQHQALYSQMREGRALEDLQQLLSPLRLPDPLLLRVSGCEGIKNAWSGAGIVNICYELLADILQNAAESDLPIGISKADTIIGPVLDVFLHETAHSVFRMLKIPILGREEDAADQFAAYLTLKLGGSEARRMVLGTAYGYKREVPGNEVSVPVRTLADEHSLPAQRLYTLLCLAYGADQKLFADIVAKGFLPEERAAGCAVEYGDLDFAMTKLIRPYVDMQLAKKFRVVWTRTISARRERLLRR